MGYGPRQAERLEVREWMLMAQAHRRKERVRWQRSLGIVNTIRAIVGEDPIEMGKMKEAGGAEDRDKDAIEAMKWRNRDFFEEDLTEYTLLDKAREKANGSSSG